ncbi:MAG: DUF805 domain-containing protein [Alphaproteobacteria bacterium]
MREFWKAELTMLRFLFSPVGRISRKDFWLLFFIPYNVVGTVIFVPLLGAVDLGNTRDVFWFVAFELVALWILIAVLGRRLHDCGITSWPILAVTLAGFALMEIGWALRGGDWRETQIDLEKMTGFPFLIGLIGVFLGAAGGGLAILCAMLVPGQKGDNRFGSDPLEGRR